MPIYNVNGKKYNIPDNLASKFENDMPDASVQYEANGKFYDIPLSKREAFMQSFPNAKYRIGESAKPQQEEYPQEVLDAYNDPNNKPPHFKDISAINSDYQQRKQAANDVKAQEAASQPMLDDSRMVSTPNGMMPDLRSAGKRVNPKQPTETQNNEQPNIAYPFAKEQNFNDKAWDIAHMNEKPEQKRFDYRHPESGFINPTTKKSEDQQNVAEGMKRVKEDEEILKNVTLKPEQTAKDVYENAMMRFSNTEQGIAMQEEANEAMSQHIGTLQNEFIHSKEYKDIMSQKPTTQEEADKLTQQLNDAFQEKYGEEIEKFMQPYQDKMDEAIEQRYGGSIAEGMKKVQAKVAGEKLTEVQGTIDALQGKHGQNANGSLRAANHLIENAQEILDAANRNDTNFLKELGHGFWDKLDARNFTLGLSDLLDNTNLKIALEASEKGETLSKEQEALLEAAAINMAIQGYYGSDLSRGYKAGQMTSESIPFMLEIIANPISGSGNAIAKGLLKYGMKRFGTKAARSAASRFAARAIGESVAAARMTSTTGVPRVLADMQDRLNNNFNVTLDSNGKAQVERVGNTSDMEALSQAMRSNFFEYQSETIFNALRGAGALLPKPLTNAIKNIQRSGVGKVYKNTIGSEFAKRAQFHGLWGEYAEEVYNNLSNVATGDMTLEQATSLDQNIDTFLGLAPTSVLFGALGIGTYSREKHQNRVNMERAFGQMNDEQRAQLAELQEMAQGSQKEAINRQVKKFLQQTIAADNLTQEEKRAEIEYLFEFVKQGAINEIDEERTPEERAVDDAEEARMDGYDTITPESMNEVLTDLRATSEEFANVFGNNGLAAVETDGIGALRDIYENSGYTDEEKQLALDYINAKQRYDGMVQRVRDDIDGMIEQSNAEVDAQVNRGTGMVQLATLKLDGKQVHIIDGNVAVLEDGSIDTQNSTQDIIVRDAQTGKLEFVSPKDIGSVDEAMQPDALKAQAAENIRQTKAQEAADKIDGVLPFKVGDTYTGIGAEDQPAQIQILQDNGDGTYMVSIDGQPATQPMQKEAIQQMVDKARAQDASVRLAEKKEQRAASQAAATVQPQERTYALNDEVPVTLQNGEQGTAIINSEPDADGNYEVELTDNNGNTIGVQLLSKEQLDAMAAIKPSQDVTVSNEDNTGAEATTEELAGESAGESVQPAVPVTETPAEDAMPMIEVDGEMVPDYAHATPQRSQRYIYEESGLSNGDADDLVKLKQKRAKQKLEEARKKEPKFGDRGIGDSIAKLQKAKAEWSQKVQDAENEVAYWNSVEQEQAMKLRQAQAAQAAEAAEKQRKRTEEAIKEEQERKAEEKRKQEEQEAVGANNVNPAIREKWNAAPKVEGARNEIVLANGERIAGRYVLVESGAASPSHDALNGFKRTEGFPIDENGQSVNDRDYERDVNAQRITRDIASNYDQRALQNPVVVSQDGVVLSGNGRTMAGELAAEQGTDAAYIDYLKKYPEQFGFTAEQVGQMQHPRVVFVPDEQMPYTAETFGKFNQQEMKGQSKTEQSVKLGKVVDDTTFNRIIQLINGYETLGAFYADSKATREAIKELQNAGAINDMQLAEMFDGETISAQGREILENVLIGKAFEKNPDAIRMITAYKSMRQSVIFALAEIANNVALGKDYSLQDELAKAIALVYEARNKGAFKEGEKVSSYARQGNLFQLDDGSTVADYTDTIVMLLADVMNDKRTSQLKKIMSLYNANAAESASGQMDIFSGSVQSKEEIIKFVEKLLNNGTEQKQQQSETEGKQSEQQPEQEGQGTEEAAPSGESNQGSEVEGQSEEQEPTEEEAQQENVIQGEGYTISPATYTTKRGKELSMQLVKFDNLTEEQRKALGRIADELKGWWSKDNGGFLMRDMETAEQLAKAFQSLKEEKPNTKAEATEEKKEDPAAKQEQQEEVEQPNQRLSQYYLEMEKDVYERRLNRLREQYKDNPPSNEELENKIQQFSKEVKQYEEEVDNASEQDKPFAQGRLASASGSLRAFITFKNETIKEAKQEQPEEKKQESKEYVLTLEDLEASDLNEAVKSGARAWLNGDKSPANQLAFLAAQDYVRDYNRNHERGGSNADQAQLGSADNGTANGENGRGNGESGLVDSENRGEGISSNGTSGEDSTPDVASSNGEGGDRGLSGDSSREGVGSSSSQSRGSGRNGRKGSNGGRKGQRSGKSVSERDASDEARAAAKSELDDALKEFEDILKESFTEPVKGKMLAADPVSLYTYLGAVKAIKLLTAGSKVAYAAVKLGYYQFKDWYQVMMSKLGSLLRDLAKLNDEQIDEFIKMMWDYSITIDGETHKVCEWASMISDAKLREQVGMTIEQKRKLQKEAEGTPTVIADITNIRESLPFLLPKQQEDVQKAEHQFFSEDHADAKHGHGKGYMFTNGTGTGKTYTGLGIVKRFLKQGKKRILIVTAQETKINDWIKDAKNLGIEATMLPDTKSKGSGVVVTQYANMRQNRALLEDEFDLIVYDESHKLMENQDGMPTTASRQHHMLSNRDIRQAARRMLMSGEYGKKFDEAEEELNLLNQALNIPSTKWTDEVKKAYRKAGGTKDSVEERVNELRQYIEKFEENIEEEVNKLLADPEKAEQARAAVGKTKVVFLSATPFNKPANLDYTEGYIFSYTNSDEVVSEIDRLRQRDNFLIGNFNASHQRNPKTLSVSAIPQERIPDPLLASEEEVKFSDYLQQDLETMSGRDLDSEYDYSREFPRMDFPMAEIFNDAIQSLTDGRFNVLEEYFDHLLKDYNTMTGYLEIFKAQMIAPRIREYIDLGKKVTLFHRRKATNSDLFPPFALAMQKAREASKGDKAKEDAIDAFEQTYHNLFEWELSINYMFPQESILREFMTDKEKATYDNAVREWHTKYDGELDRLKGNLLLLNMTLQSNTGDDADTIMDAIRRTNKAIQDIMKKHPKPKSALVSVFNGSETEKDKRAAVEDFNNDKGTTKVLVVQVQSGKEGISLHDTTGNFPRVQIGIFLPQSPIEFIQTEGRIFRVGNKSNAIFEYPMLGLDIELSNFALKINGRSETTENLALGSRGRGLKESISRSALASRHMSPEDVKGIGGKELDSRKAQQDDGFSTAVKNYGEWREEPKPTDVNDVEIPDPIGFMMAKWGNIENGERVLVPNARRGSIARYIPTRSRLTATEQHNKDFARLSALIGGSGRKVMNESFDDHSRVNKYDVVVMNSKHGTYKEKSALGIGTPKSYDAEDVVKAFKHLDDSGRVIAVVESSKVRDIETALRSLSQSAVMVGEVKLPNFLMNGTPSSIIVVDKIDNKELRAQVGEKNTIDLSSAKNEDELFAQIREVIVPERKIDKVGKIDRRLRPMVNVFINTGLLAKEKNYATGKMEPDCHLNRGHFFATFQRGKMAFKTYDGHSWRNFWIDGEKIADNDMDYISELSRDWVKQNSFLNMDDDELYRIYAGYVGYDKTKLVGVRDCLRAIVQSIELALDKTPMQIRNLAEGKVENEVSGSYDLKGFREAFDSLNADNAEIEALADKVFDAISQIDGIQFKVVDKSAFRSSAGHSVVAHYVPSRNIIEINGDSFNSIRLSDAFKAQTIVHEMIHALTSWAIETYNNPNTSHLLTKEQQEAVKTIKDVYAQINNDEFRNNLRLNSRAEDNAEYGLTNEHEMMAELANPVFRAMLKAKKLWKQLINGVKMLLGIQIPGVEGEQTDALTVLDNALETLMNNFSPELYQGYSRSGNAEVRNLEFKETSSERKKRIKEEKEKINKYIEDAISFVTGRNRSDVRKKLREDEQNRKQLFKEISENVLQGNFDDVTLQKINDYIASVTPNNPYGRRLSERLPQAVERKMYGRERTGSVDALFSRISESSVRPNERTGEAGRRAIEEKKKELLEGWAKSTGHWYTDLSSFTNSKEPFGKGTDSDVYVSKDNEYAIKVSKGKPYGKRFRPDIDNIPLFNYVFPNSAYKILGYGNIDGKFVRILQQPLVDFAKSIPLTKSERVSYMSNLGFLPINKEATAFSNGEIIVSDLQKNNIVKDEAGNIRVIDADTKLHTTDVGGIYEYPPVEENYPEGTLLSEPSEAYGEDEEYVTDMDDDELLDKIEYSSFQNLDEYSEEYDRRHEDDYSNYLEQAETWIEENKPSAEEANRTLSELLTRWRRGGYKSPERSAINAQIIAYDNYIAALKEEESDKLEPEDLEPGAHPSETKKDTQTYVTQTGKQQTYTQLSLDFTEQKEEEKPKEKKQQTPLDYKLPRLKEGEISYVERKFTEDKTFTLTSGKDKIESADDVAYIFRCLEDKAIEHTFLVFEKNGVPTVIHAGMGSHNQAPVDSASIPVMLDRLKPDRIYMVHNHPSGSLRPSNEDRKLSEALRNMVPSKIPMHFIIIDTYKHQYTEFSNAGSYDNGVDIKGTGNNVSYPTYAFDSKSYRDGFAGKQAFSSVNIADYINTIRLGDVSKVGALVMDQNMNIVGNLILNINNADELSDKVVRKLLSNTMMMGGSQLVFYGSGITSSSADKKKMGAIIKGVAALTNGGVRVTDVMAMDKGGDYGYYYSFNDEGVMEPSESYSNVANDSGVSQRFGSAATSLNQVARAFGKIDWKKGTTNLDLGGGKFDRATDFLREKGVENMVFDPFNRSAEHNKETAERVRNEKVDTVTCNNVLNVVESQSSRDNIILQAARALKGNGTAYFSVYEGNKSGVGRQTKSDSWQNNRPTKDYVKEIEKFFNDVTLKDNIITARNPKQADGESVWDFDGSYSGNDIRFREEDAPVFFSNAERAIQNIKQDKATPQQWLAMIEKNGGLKAGEDKWLGLSDWLKGNKSKSLTKQEVLDYIRENQIQVEDVNYGDEVYSTEDYLEEENPGWKNAFKIERDMDGEPYVAIKNAEEAARIYNEKNPSSRSIEVDEEGYIDEDGMLDLQDWADLQASNANLSHRGRNINPTRITYTTEGLDNKREIALVVPTIENWNEDDNIHFGDAGEGRAVAWIRFGETTDTDGNRVLVIDEIQSKRHQEGRDQGYKSEFGSSPRGQYHEAHDKLTAYEKELENKYGEGYLEDALTDEERKKYKELFDDTVAKSEYTDDKLYNIPDAPFDKNWHELAMKRMLRYAAENGYDKVAWTKGAQQAKRYSLSTTISKIEKERKNRDITYVDLTVADTNGIISLEVNNDGVVEGVNQSRYDNFVGQPLSNVIGKEWADEVLNSRKRTFNMGEMAIGGEGMSGFYDEILPRFMNKYGKKWGVKVGEVELPNVEEAGRTMWSVDVTPEMRESVLQGQPMFREIYRRNSEIAYNFARKNKGVGRVAVITAENGYDILRQRGVDEAKAREYMEEFKSGLRGLCLYGNDLIVAFDNGNVSEEKINSYLWHEAGHRVVRYYNIPKEWIDEIAEYTKADSPEFYEDIQQLYSDHSESDRNEEYITFMLEELGKMSDKEIIDGLEQLYNSEIPVERYMGAIINIIRYGTEERNNGLLQETRSIDQKPQAVEMRNDGAAERGRSQAEEAIEQEVNRLADNLGVPVTIIESIDDIPESEAKARKRIADGRNVKGWYNDGRIYIYLPNASDVNDARATVLHEAIAHYGLRKLLGKRFDSFMHELYEKADAPIRAQVERLAKRYGWDFPLAMEEYLAGLAERTNFEQAKESGWWNRIKEAFYKVLEYLGLGRFNGTLSDNELRYLLWRSYENLKNNADGVRREGDIFDEAADIAMQNELGVGEYLAPSNGGAFREDYSMRDKAIARDAYEREVQSGMFQFREATQDSMRGLHSLYKAIEGKDFKEIKDIPGYENAYLAENRMSSQSAAEQHNFFNRYMTPLLEAIGKLTGKDEAKRQELTDYMMAKHGLERNEVMARRDAERAAAEKFDKDIAILEKAHAENPLDTLVSNQLDDLKRKKEDFIITQTEKNRGTDYAGLTGLTGEEKVEDAERVAQQMVDDYEANHDAADVQGVWDAVKEATHATLEKLYLSGLMNKDTYDKTLAMFENYIPLRGWDETTSDEVYGYLAGKNGPLMGSVLKSAEGRGSKADDPIAYIAQMADKAIMEGNRNRMKQTFLNYVLNHPSDLVSVNDIWLQHDDVTDEWVAVFPDLEPTDTASEVERKVNEFEERMAQMASADPDHFKRGRENPNVPYKVVKGNMREHQVLVKRNGKTYVLTINGNPRAAQALNGLTNPDTEVTGAVGNLLKMGEFVNRKLSSFYTTRNPDFVVSNFFRDMVYSNVMSWVKESPAYALRFHRNVGRVNPATMRKLLGKWENGTLDESNYTEKMFKQFMLNGGETGYTSVRDIEEQKRDIAKELKKQGSTARKVWAALGMQLDLLNRSVENCARFAAFVTSREMGRSMERSIYDAKEVSVNFNKKGSGGKMVNTVGQTALGKFGSYISGLGRVGYVFWNAGMQGMTNFGRAAKHHPAKFFTASVAVFLTGMVIPLLAQMLGGDDDDDKNAYYNLPEYVRRTNIVFFAGDQWITIPLPIELRALYGMGELATGVMTGQERYSDKELTYQMASQLSQILPLDMLEGGGGITPLIPSAAKPVVEAYVMNKRWTGLPVFKDTPFNKNDPEWTKAYSSADKTLVALSRWLNEVGGGDDFKKSEWPFMDINPAKLEYLLSGTFGGYFTTVEKMKKMAETAVGERDFDWRNMLLANRVVKSGDETTEYRKLNNEYFRYKNEADETKRLYNKYQKMIDEGEAEDADKYIGVQDKLIESDEYRRYEIFQNYKNDINEYDELINDAVSKEDEQYYKRMKFDIIKQMLDEMREK